jgi:hypothetical protein
VTPHRPRTYSASRFMAYMDCPAEYRARYVERQPVPLSVPMEFGSAVHRGLELHFRGQDGESAFRVDWRERKARLEAAGIWVPGTLLVRGLDLVETVADLDLRGEPEHEFWLTIPGIPVPIKGYADLWNVEGAYIVDYKVSGAHWDDKKLAAQRIQRALYSQAFSDTYDGRVPRFEVLVLPRNDGPVQRIDATCTPREIAETIQLCRDIAEAIEAQQFDCSCPDRKHVP